MSVAKLISAQVEISANISRHLSNYKKSKSRLTKAYVETRQESLEADFTLFRANHTEITQLIEHKEKENCDYFKQEMYYLCEDAFLELKTLMKEFLNNESLQSNQAVEQKEGTAVTTPLLTKLPAIGIPTFSGDYHEWTSFYDLFKAVIHTNKSLSNIQKYHYLKTNLRGEAEVLLRQYPLTEANYEKALELLETRYNNKRLIVTSHITRMLNQKKLPIESAKGIREMLDTTNECLSALANMGVSTTNWDPLITHMIVSKFDGETHQLWEQKLGGSRELPTIQALTEFMEMRFRSLEAINLNVKETAVRPRAQVKAFKATTELACVHCGHDHYVHQCKEFGKLSTEKRREIVKSKQLCFNCLNPNHSVKFCKQHTSCRVCKRRHHTLLHTTEGNAQIHNSRNRTDESSQLVSHKAEVYGNQVLLATAVVKTIAKDGTQHTLRALIDQGSQASFITTSAAQRLGLRKTNIIINVTGVNQTMATVSKSRVEFKMHSMHNNTFVTQVNAHVLKTLTSILPRREVNTELGSELRKLALADPSYNKPSGIDLLLGAEVHAQILLDGLIRIDSIIAQNSVLGWLISGKVEDTQSNSNTIVVMHSQLETDDLLQRFWESEELYTDTRTQTAKETQCEKLFSETHSRDSTGRYIVALPFCLEEETPLGESRQLAVKRLLQMERRFQRDTVLKQRYIEFMEEYERLQHMEKIPKEELHKEGSCYLPHHGVLREESITTKLRVVFDGSATTNTGISLNQKLLIGPSLQHDICDLFLRWRGHKICIVGDIQRMYRQILVRKEDTDVQRIVWRRTPDAPIEDWRLRTVTYGTSCAPYLAIKTLRQLANDEREKYPRAAHVLESDFYTDDLLSGGESEYEVISLRNELSQLLMSGGFVLHKWGSNSVNVLRSISGDGPLQESYDIMMGDSVKALGIKWEPKEDCFQLNIQFSPIKSKITKRYILSEIAKIYDPLGWLSPVVISAKVLLQKLWLLGLGWDDELPENVANEWSAFQRDVNAMGEVYLPRWLGLSQRNAKVEIHGFSDASQVAFSGVVYVRIIDDKGKVAVKMVTAKTRVAPVKQMSIPRLELCGAVLTAKLMHKVKKCLNIIDSNVYGWTDSTIVLAWLQKHPNCWKTFVGNRVAEILNLTFPQQWHHISTKENPADCASRGLVPTQLPEHELWWNGPHWLHKLGDIVSETEVHETNIDQKVQVHVMNVINAEYVIQDFSSLTKLTRVVAYCLRFIKIIKHRISKVKSVKIKISPFLTTNELHESLQVVIKLSQHCYFEQEFKQLAPNNDNGVSKNSALYFLRPFVDSNNIIRVGGRLQHAPIPLDSKHPIVISNKSHLAYLIVNHVHKVTLHGGPTLMLNVIRSKYWITNVKPLIKKYVHSCVTCVRHAPRFASQLMGNLPPARVTVSKPFSSSGVDFAGPVLLKPSKLRKATTIKAYIAIFICTATKALHLELVSELTTAAFIAAFKRFTARRGHCANLYSDCGTNFIGANFELQKTLARVKSSLPVELASLLASDGTSWHFIPPGSPHFGGLWERGVRSIKHHINRTIGDTKLTFEDYATLLTQVECCLNSRPISAMSDSTDDLTALTPGHFLVFGPPTVVPSENVVEVPMTRLNRWQHLDYMLQSFWKRWSQEYLTTLQQRYKWSSLTNPVKLNDLVLIKNECLPPSKWLLGRVVNTHPGSDGLVRVVTVKCQNSTFKRPITKLCVLPVNTEF